MKKLLYIGALLLAGNVAAESSEEARSALIEHGCVTCHEIPGANGANGLTGPPLTAMHRQVYIAGVVPNNFETLTNFIRNPQAIDPRSAMPKLSITRSQAEAIARFLLSAEGS
ncbi:hypothetical protein [Loktanella sp. SALINAS62]|uniref:c-type cytochrome n=1 Tax=Loktanella sp. SALINAS62 TaxID=2706124 RepID=UPI001B8C7EAD|nr:hypothetical protein [Loktanella sp. SALINAS62]MBS1303320.1 cytochrome C [Loktanella sp. SALINAS62]